MKKIKRIVPLLVVGMMSQMGVSFAETQSERESLQQLEQLQSTMAKHTQQLAQADPRMDIFKNLGAQAQSQAPAATAPAPTTPPPAAAAAAPVPPASPPAPPAGIPANPQDAAAMSAIEELQPGETAAAIDEAAFRQVQRTVAPLTPEHISKLKKIYVEDRFAAQSPVVTPPKPVATTQFINLAPGATPPVIRLAKGFVSSLVFIDSTGAPWDIESYDIGDPSSFNIQWNKKSNTLMVQANKMYTYGNMAVKLWDLNTPIMLTLVPGQKAVDYRVDLRVPSVGPMAKAPVSTSIAAGSATDNQDLLSVLNGVPPADVNEVFVSGGQAQAWVRGTTMFVRTEAQLLSPGWLSSMRSADGMNAYELPVASRLLMSVRGKIIQYKVEGL